MCCQYSWSGDGSLDLLSLELVLLCDLRLLTGNYVSVSFAFMSCSTTVVGVVAASFLTLRPVSKSAHVMSRNRQPSLSCASSRGNTVRAVARPSFVQTVHVLNQTTESQLSSGWCRIFPYWVPRCAGISILHTTTRDPKSYGHRSVAATSLLQKLQASIRTARTTVEPGRLIMCRSRLTSLGASCPGTVFSVTVSSYVETPTRVLTCVHHAASPSRVVQAVCKHMRKMFLRCSQLEQFPCVKELLFRVERYTRAADVRWHGYSTAGTWPASAPKLEQSAPHLELHTRSTKPHDIVTNDASDVYLVSGVRLRM